MKVYIGIDVGTTSLKAVAIDGSGKKLASAKAAYELHADGVKVTQSALDWWRAACEAIQAIVDELKTLHPDAKIVAISTSAQGGSATALDESGKPMIEAMSWMDKRATAECEELKAAIGADEFYERFGWMLQPSSDASKLLWLKKYAPEVYDSATCFPSTLGYINYCLTGKLAEDPTCAAIRRLYNFSTDEFDREVLEYLALSEGKLPVTLPTASLVGNLTKDAADALGLDTDVKVYNGAHDQYCSSIGSGIVDAGKLLLATGTAWVLFGVTEQALFSDSRISPCRHPAGKYGVLSTISGIGATLEWFSALCATPIPELDIEAERRIGKSDSLFFRPSASGTGLLIGKSLGAHLSGVSLGHDKYDLALALMEGAAFETALNIEEYKKSGMSAPCSITMAGGATASRFWQSLIADVTGLDVFASTQTDSPALGAAIIAAASEREENVAIAAKRASAESLKVSPSEYSEYYQTKFKAYKEWRKSHP
jgi:sugar (pentulose or hexulose) kinase